MCGGRVIAEIMYCDFLGRSGDEVFNQLPKWQAMSGNIIKMPVVIRVSVDQNMGHSTHRTGHPLLHIFPD